MGLNLVKQGENFDHFNFLRYEARHGEGFVKRETVKTVLILRPLNPHE